MNTSSWVFMGDGVSLLLRRPTDTEAAEAIAEVADRLVLHWDAAKLAVIRPVPRTDQLSHVEFLAIVGAAVASALAPICVEGSRGLKDAHGRDLGTKDRAVLAAVMAGPLTGPFLHWLERPDAPLPNSTVANARRAYRRPVGPIAVVCRQLAVRAPHLCPELLDRIRSNPAPSTAGATKEDNP